MNRSTQAHESEEFKSYLASFTTDTIAVLKKMDDPSKYLPTILMVDQEGGFRTIVFDCDNNEFAKCIDEFISTEHSQLAKSKYLFFSKVAVDLSCVFITGISDSLSECGSIIYFRKQYETEYYLHENMHPETTNYAKIIFALSQNHDTQS